MGRFYRAGRPLKWVVFALSLVLVGGALGWAALLMRPIQPGNARDFWSGVRGLKFSDEERSDFSVYGTLYGRYFYRRPSLTEPDDILEAPAAEVRALFPEVLDRLLADPSEIESVQLRALLDHAIADRKTSYEELALYRDDIGQSVERMDNFINASCWAETCFLVEHLGLRGSYILEHADGRWFGVRLDRADRYWMNIVFEAVFFSLVLGMLWLPILSVRVRRWAPWLWGALPLVIPGPYYLGYCRLAFWSYTPPLWGGALYPWLVVLLRPLEKLTTAVEWHFVGALSPVLGPLNQVGLSESAMDLHVPRLGFLVPAAVGLAVGMVTWAIQRVARRRAAARNAPTKVGG